MALSARFLLLRRSPILLKLPPYLSALCVIIGIAWLFILPLNEYSRQTYISENAVLPGQAYTYFGGSDHNVFRAYRHEVFALSQQTKEERVEGLSRVMRENGLKVAEQPYSYRVAGQEIKGTNVYGLLRGPRADATEAMVLIAAWTNFDGELNYSGVALALTLMRYFKRWSIWSKDIFLLIPEDSTYGPEAWVSAYHSTYTAVTPTRNVSSLPIKAGALQAAVALDYPVGPWGKRFEKLDIVYDGVNGALPNLDLLNTAIQVARGQVGISCSLHGMTKHSDSYVDRLTTIAKGVVTQGAGHATGPHSAFMPYHVDAITLKTVGDGWHDEMSLGRTAESLFRSINNLLEHLHQSFFFYILLSANRFVSIGNYLPAAMLIAGSFTITALALWMQSGRRDDKPASTSEKVPVQMGGDVALVPKAETVERRMLLPALVLLAVQTLSIIPLSLLNHVDQSHLTSALHLQTAISLLLPPGVAVLLRAPGLHITTQQLQILQSLSLLLLGAALSTLATLNFSLAFVLAFLAAPLNFARPLPAPRSAATVALAALAPALYYAASPSVLLYALTAAFAKDLQAVLLEMARGWHAQGVWTGFIVWGVWWPAWVVSGVVLFSGITRPGEKIEEEEKTKKQKPKPKRKQEDEGKEA